MSADGIPEPTLGTQGMASRSFLTPREAEAFEAFETRFEWWRRNGLRQMAVALILVAVAAGATWYWARGRLDEVTRSIAPARQTYKGIPLVITGQEGTLCEIQDAAALIVVLVVPMTAFITLFAVASAGSTVAVWRSTKALARLERGESLPAMAAPERRPSRYGRRPARWLMLTLRGGAIGEAERRNRLYGATMRKRLKWQRSKVMIVVSYLMWWLAPLAYVLGVGFIALSAGRPWHYAYGRLFFQYSRSGTYPFYDVILVSRLLLAYAGTVIAMVGAYFMSSLFVPRSLPAWTLIREMRRLDVLLWRRTRSNAVARP